MKSQSAFDYFLDISQEVCPLTLVRAKLFLEGLAPGVAAVIRLSGRTVKENLPQALTELGHEVLTLEPDSDTAEQRQELYRLHLRTAPPADRTPRQRSAGPDDTAFPIPGGITPADRPNGSH